MLAQLHRQGRFIRAQSGDSILLLYTRDMETREGQTEIFDARQPNVTAGSLCLHLNTASKMAEG